MPRFGVCLREVGAEVGFNPLMTEVPQAPRDAVGEALEKLRRAEREDDATRLELLEQVYETLESELDRGFDQTASSGR